MSRSLQPLRAALAPEWASGWGEDRFGVFVEFEIGGVETRLRWVGPGRFWMGSPENEHGRHSDERWHEAKLSEGYWLGEAACTQALWANVLGENPSEFKGEERPIERVSWEDCQRFLARVNERVPGLAMRLPSEAEWEYACRARTWTEPQTPFWFGEDITPEQVNYDGNYPYRGTAKGRNRKETVPVKALGPNGWGFYQMHGNVWEWCRDVYGEYAAGPVRDPWGPWESVGSGGKGAGRVLRGGSWNSSAASARSAARNLGDAGDRYGNAGFRFARG